MDFTIISNSVNKHAPYQEHKLTSHIAFKEAGSCS
jgi:hypothetical protein